MSRRKWNKIQASGFRFVKRMQFFYWIQICIHYVSEYRFFNCIIPLDVAVSTLGLFRCQGNNRRQAKLFTYTCLCHQAVIGNSHMATKGNCRSNIALTMCQVISFVIVLLSTWVLCVYMFLFPHIFSIVCFTVTVFLFTTCTFVKHMINRGTDGQTDQLIDQSIYGIMA